MSSLSPALRLFPVLLILLSTPLHATDITDVRWQGEDLLLRFSDSVPYSVDLAESDTNQVIVRISPLTLPASLATELQGPAGRTLLLTGASPGELRVTVRSSDRMGYGIVWRPYTHTLIIHTFRWRQLGYAEEQYFKGLLAFEQQLDAQGIEFLRLAYAAGDRRAASALGIYYARHGEEALAAQYLTQPLEADDFAALAQVKRKLGDTVAAAEMERSFMQLSDSRRGGVPATASRSARTRPDSSATASTTIANWFSRENIPTIAIVGGGLLLLIIVIVILARRPGYDPVFASSPEPKRKEWIDPKNETVAAKIDTPPVEPEPAPVQETPVEIAAAEEVKDEPSEVETFVVEPTFIQEQGGIEAPPDSAPPVVRDASSEEIVADVPAEPRDRRSRIASQASDLRRRIEEMRAKTEEKDIDEIDPEADPSIVSEARRLHLSRDSVELRRRLENAR